MIHKEIVHRLNESIDAFEEAVKAHEHVGMLGSEVVLREELERARTRLCETVSRLLDETKQED